MPSMLEKRMGAAAAVLNGFPYVCGGHDGQWCLQSVERFSIDPRNNKNGQWQAMHKMHHVRYDGMACACDANDRRTKIFVFGGSNGAERIAEVECFDGNEWEPVPKNTKANCQRMQIRGGAAVAAMLEPENAAEKAAATMLEMALGT